MSEVYLKINGKEIKNIGCFAYDGCHKIYILETSEEVEQAKEVGYDIIPIKELDTIYNTSCDLVFISNWSLDKMYVEQLFNDKVVFDFS